VTGQGAAPDGGGLPGLPGDRRGGAGALEGPAARDGAAALGWLARIGLAIHHPRWALAIAADRRAAGRSGSDLIAAIAVLLLATQLRGLATSVWLGVVVAPGLGLRAVMHLPTSALMVDLGLLLVSALALFALAGPRRNLGRAFDLACVAVIPLIVVDLVATVIVRAADVAALPAAAGWMLSGFSYGWMGALIALAVRPARGAPRVPAPPAPIVRRARWIGAAVAAVAAIGVAVQIAWIAGHLDLVRPMERGAQAPEIAVQRIAAGGQLAERTTLAASRGKITVLDFWATWCKPCLAALPRLDEFTRAHPEVAVIAINLDDAAAARALFDQRGYRMALAWDEGDAAERYGVSSIPHTVIIDPRGVVRNVHRGFAGDVAATLGAEISTIVETDRTSP